MFHDVIEQSTEKFFERKQTIVDLLQAVSRYTFLSHYMTDLKLHRTK